MSLPSLGRTDITTALSLASAEAAPARWDLETLSGRLVELSAAGASASLTMAFGVVLEAQRRGEPAAWITEEADSFYPPDAAEGGVDLRALVVIRVSKFRQALRAADHLTRSGAFGLLVLDLGDSASLPLPAQTRLAGLAARHRSAILLLTRKRPEAPSLGSLVSLRGETWRERQGGDRFLCRVRVLKDKRRGPGWAHEELCRAPDGLC